MPKCGTVSLQAYLKTRFPGKEAVRVEQIWKADRVRDVSDKRPESHWHYVIILRDNVERIWSNYHYFDMYDKMTLEEYLQYDINGTRMGIANPIKQGNYGHWLKIWEPLNPIIVTLEEMSKMEGFPHMNKTGERRDYPEMKQSDRDLISSYLNKNEVIVNG